MYAVSPTELHDHLRYPCTLLQGMARGEIGPAGFSREAAVTDNQIDQPHAALAGLDRQTVYLLTSDEPRGDAGINQFVS